jgi:hypothetical protein
MSAAAVQQLAGVLQAASIGAVGWFLVEKFCWKIVPGSLTISQSHLQFRIL